VNPAAMFLPPVAKDTKLNGKEPTADFF
jgi:hypothetical protein